LIPPRETFGPWGIHHNAKQSLIRPSEHVRYKYDSINTAMHPEMIEGALAESRGRISGAAGAAAKLAIPVPTLESKIKRLGIKNSVQSPALADWSAGI
jgi:DNA-binding NtrC family response regulator